MAAIDFGDVAYRALGVAVDLGMSRAPDALDLSHEAYAVREASRSERLAYLGVLVNDTMMSTYDVYRLPHLAKSIHVVSVPMLNEVAPSELLALLGPPVRVFMDRRRDCPGVNRYIGLLLRTMSLAASKEDRYTNAFRFIDFAYRRCLEDSAGFDDRLVLEALQQISLQECGQLCRNVEAALLEQDRLRADANRGEKDGRRRLDDRLLTSMRVNVRGAVHAGEMADRYVTRLLFDHDLPVKVDPDEDELAVSSWVLTCRIMYMRSLLLAELVDRCSGRADPGHLDKVPELWASIVERYPHADHRSDPTLAKSHRCDMTRNALMWAFLTGCSHPYDRGRRRPIRKGVPDFMVTPVARGRMDTRACADLLVDARQNANFIDDVAHLKVYQALVQGSMCSELDRRVLSYEDWLRYRARRILQIQPVGGTLTIARTTSRSTLDALVASARMVRGTDRHMSLFGG